MNSLIPTGKMVVGGVVAVIAVGLIFRHFGDAPVVVDARKGFQGLL